MLPTLLTLGGRKISGLVSNFFKDDEEGQLARDTVRGLPKASLGVAQEMGQASFRGFAAVASGLHSGGQRIQAAIDPFKTYEEYEKDFSLDLKPTGPFQEALFGTKEAITPGSFGKELRSGLGGEDLAIDPLLGFAVGFADAIPGGAGAKRVVTAGGKTASAVYTKYGPTIGKKIEQLGDSMMELSLVKGSEEKIAHALNVPEIDVTIQKLVDGFVDVNRARTETEQARVAERATRAAKAEAAIEGTEGFESLKAARGAMRGEMTQAELPGAVAARLDEKETNSLFNHIRTSDLRVYEKANALEGLARMLGDQFYNGELPTQSQMKLLKQVFGEPFVRNYNQTAGRLGARIAETIAQVANIPRALMSSLDLSAPLRQGLLLGVDNPKNAVKAFGSMLRFFADERYFNAAMDSIHNSKMAKLRQASGLEITDVSGQNFSLGTKEEAFMTDLITKGALQGDVIRTVAGAGAGALTGDTAEERMRNALIGAGLGFASRLGVGASERAYTGFLNKLRADVFDDVAGEYLKNGMRPETHSDEFEGLARFINVATGRGEIKGKLLQGSAPLLNAVFFSPRFLASRFQMFNPKFYYNLPPEARKMAARSVMKLIGTGVGVLGLASLSDKVDVQLDPRSSDFGKIRMGQYRYDIWGGFQQIAVLLSRLVTGETKSAGSGDVSSLNGEEFFGQTRLSVLARFFRSKLAPVTGAAVDLLEGTNVVGEDVNLQQQIQSKLLPFYIQDLIEAADAEGILHPSLKLSPGLFGVGVQRFETRRNVRIPGFGGGSTSLPGFGLGAGRSLPGI